MFGCCVFLWLLVFWVWCCFSLVVILRHDFDMTLGFYCLFGRVPFLLGVLFGFYQGWGLVSAVLFYCGESCVDYKNFGECVFWCEVSAECDY